CAWFGGRPAEGVPPGVDGAEHGLRRRRVPGLRDHGGERRAATGLPRGAGVRRRGSRLGVRLVKAKRRVTTSKDVRVAPRRTPTVRKSRPMIGGSPSAPPSPPGATRRRPVVEPAPAVESSIAPTDVDLSVDLGRGLVLANPILVASGTFGYGIEYGDVVEVDRLGAICCQGTTLKPRIGNITPRVTETPGGMLNSIGLQNPGVDAVIEKYAATWTGWKPAVIANVAGETAG